ncbi:hypothetical protein UFOVP232_74 [uncultured Caudovirales phage]|uniref:dATP/dGTP diphosphohydrolase N-terminal domain-containing protein n=1 Tax=uncultured Caudovirales phage TaxID=2100421 RepID=A0A6J7WR20_9CAUD|nr:hypothetical protein UFOVP232_74 [uncultured Caudovirales phage]
MTEENRHWWEKPTRDDKIRDPLAGMKFDSGKLDYTLVPWDGMEEVIKVLEFGAKKYARDNWKHVENADIRYLAAAFRHIVQYNNGEMTDKETGLSHLAHAGCCLLFLLSLEKQNGSDKR